MLLLHRGEGGARMLLFHRGKGGATRRRFRARALLPPGCPASVSESEE